MPVTANKNQPRKPLSKLPPARKPLFEPLWKGPEVDGITFSLLSKFINCRERFRKRVVEGLVEDLGFNHAIEFGCMWHEAEEALCSIATGKVLSRQEQEKLAALPQVKMKKYYNSLINKHPGAERSIIKWYEICKRQFSIYQDYWTEHPDEQSRKRLVEEVSFRIPYKLPSGRTVILRGKWDAVMLLNRPDKKDDPVAYKTWMEHWPDAKVGIINQENKTKGDIDEEGLLKTLHRNLQTMIYHIALRQLEQPGEHDLRFMPNDAALRLTDALGKYPITGMLYNVIRRPLSDRYAIKQKKSETEREFYDRLAEIIRLEPSHYFKRWRIVLPPQEIDEFRTQILDPLLEQLCYWWDWILADPLDPWRPRLPSEIGGQDYRNAMNSKDSSLAAKFTSEILKGLDEEPMPNALHWQAPWGVYDSLASGFRGDYFEYLTTGRTVGLTKIKSLFPELAPTP